jgi:hypothetical protein
MGWLAALFVGLIGWLLTHDMRTRETALTAGRVRRDTRPGRYWTIMAFWALCLLLSALLALGEYLYRTNCTGTPCTIELRVAGPGPTADSHR